MTQALNQLLDAIRVFHENHAILRAFSPFPDHMTPTWQSAIEMPSTRLTASWPLCGDQYSDPVVQAIRDAAMDAAWRQAYTLKEVGEKFINNHNYFELYGPAGHFTTSQSRGYISYWGAGLHYDWHEHEAQELYVVLSGTAEFLADGMDPVHLTTGQTRLHLSNQRHAMITHEHPVLTYVVWRGPGLDGMSKMSSS